MSKNDPPIVLAKVDANEETNRGLATDFEVQGFPTVKILRNGGKNAQEYKGPREADGIVDYLKKQAGPASAEIKTTEDASGLITDKKIVVVSALYRSLNFCPGLLCFESPSLWGVLGIIIIIHIIAGWSIP